jgi:hypothetical protein
MPTMTTTTTPARLFYGAGLRLVESGADPAAVSRAAFAAAFNLAYDVAPPAVVYAQVRQALAELEQCDTEGGSHD